MSDAVIGQQFPSIKAGSNVTMGFSRRGCLKSIAVMAMLKLMLPFSLSLTLTAWLAQRLVASPQVPFNGKTVMLTGGKMTKALQLARLFRRGGYQVVLCETEDYRYTAHRFSNAVDRFVIIPDATSDAYTDALCEIVSCHKVDFFVPVCSPVSSFFDAQARSRMEKLCRVIHVGPKQIEMLDNKFLFAKSSESVGLTVPETVRITHVQQVLDFDFSRHDRPFVLKSIAYDPLRRLDMTKLPMDSVAATKQHLATLPICESNPWILQEFISGQEFCTHSTVVDGQVRVHVCCESSAFQVNYGSIDEPEILEWVKAYCQSHNLTGQVSFDFIKADDDGKFYAIECNPRTHSAITAFYANEDVAAAYCGTEFMETVVPDSTSRPTYWIAHEIWRIATAVLRGNIAETSKRIAVVRDGKEAVFDWRDPLPFLMLHHLHVPHLLFKSAMRGRNWLKIDFNIGKLVRAGGD